MIRDQETMQLLLDSIRNFVQEELIPREEEVAESDEIPEDIVSQMRDMGSSASPSPRSTVDLG